jgi:hypothetical protein
LPIVEEFLARLRALTRLEIAGHELALEQLKELQDVHARIIDRLTETTIRRGAAVTDDLARCTDLCLAEPHS